MAMCVVAVMVVVVSSGSTCRKGARESQDLPIHVIRLAIQQSICAFCSKSTKWSIALLRVECRIDIDRRIAVHSTRWNTIPKLVMYVCVAWRMDRE